ncbi:MAG: hypothetical protein IKY02_05380 [Lachnospiraceae bacterium]|nr:hypothetical protein [Lachnospiraceae bacterium]
MFDGFLDILKRGLKKVFGNRLYVFGLLLLIPAVILVVRLVDLQLVKGNVYYDNYVNTTKKEVSIPAMRGNIYDRNGILLAGNRVVYSVAISDENYYSKENGAFNEMLLRLIAILERYDVSLSNNIPIRVNDAGGYEYHGTESRIRLLIRDVYGTKKIQELAEEGIDAYQYPASQVMDRMKTIYNFTSKWERGSEVSAADALKICNIRYQMASTTYTRYITTIVAKDINDAVKAAVMESRADLLGVNVEESYERVYYNSECFSSFLGYVGSITSEEIEEFNAAGGDYVAGDMIGKQGIEYTYESYLQGTKGRKQMYVNSTGVILSEEVLQEPQKGNDIYLSIDANITIAAYNVMEQQLAGVIIDNLYTGTDYDPEEAYLNSAYKTPIRDVYFQMLNNNVVSIRDFALAGASETERKMDEKRSNLKAGVIRNLKTYLTERSKEPLSGLDTYDRAYVQYLYTYMADEGYLVRSLINTKDEVYVSWTAGEISFPDFLLYALRSGWVDMSKIGGEERYDTVDACYEYMVNILLLAINADYGSFDKLIYDELIHTDQILGTEVAIALYEQGVLKMDEAMYQKLLTGTNDDAYEFFRERINSMQITPSQIALDPCSAGLVLTDPNSGRLLSVVSYPGYDLNRLNDSEYYSALLTSLSSPLYSRATQTRLAPGSTFKMVTAVAALEGGYLKPYETIYCSGTFDKLDHPRCWIGRLQNGEHGALDIVHAIGQSCNCFFYECGYRFSLNQNGLYNPSTGIAVINKYASMFGFGSKSGIETTENVSIISTELPVTSAIGQGTHAFTTISLARYVTAIASYGNLSEFKLLEHIEDQEGETLLSYTPEVVSHIELSDSTWDLVQRGMYMVVHEGGSRSSDFISLKYQYTAKSGSAQENRLRPEHGLYVTCGPYKNCQYAMAVQVPNGYNAGNAARIAKGVYEYLEGDITLEEILSNSAAKGADYVGD